MLYETLYRHFEPTGTITLSHFIIRYQLVRVGRYTTEEKVPVVIDIAFMYARLRPLNRHQDPIQVAVLQGFRHTDRGVVPSCVTNRSILIDSQVTLRTGSFIY